MIDLPKVDINQTIGLVGGSFDPPHEGHMHIAKWALSTLPLDKLWWVVSQRNPLKAHSFTDFQKRFDDTKKLVNQSNMLVTDVERQLNVNFSVDLIKRLKIEYPTVKFIWIMGADGLKHFHKWKDWEVIFEMLPIAIFARPGYNEFSTTVAALKYKDSFLPSDNAVQLPYRKAPAWAFFNIPMKNISSTEIRNSEH